MSHIILQTSFPLEDNLNLSASETKIYQFANSVGPDEVAYNENYTVCPLVFDFSI